MEKRPRHRILIDAARHVLHYVILEQRAATEELRVNNSELERLLEEMLASRSDLRPLIAADRPVADTPASLPCETATDRSIAQMKREVDAILEQGRAEIRRSLALRRASERVREAVRGSAAGKAAAAPPPSGLSRREHQVLTLIVAGTSSKEIAAELGISFKTAVTHRASLMSKLDVHEIASVVREAIRRGLV
jgi:DNA-binding CsgD family transcriptional regulator